MIINDFKSKSFIILLSLAIAIAFAFYIDMPFAADTSIPNRTATGSIADEDSVPTYDASQAAGATRTVENLKDHITAAIDATNVENAANIGTATNVTTATDISGTATTVTTATDISGTATAVTTATDISGTATNVEAATTVTTATTVTQATTVTNSTNTSVVNMEDEGVTASAPEINLTCDGNTATAAEITSVCDGNTSTASQINNKIAETFVTDANGSLMLDGTSSINAVASITMNTWQSIGPTGSGADYISSSMDVIPTGVDWIHIRVYLYSYTSTISSNSYTSEAFARKTGSTDFATSENCVAACSANGHSFSSGNDYGIVMMRDVGAERVPVDSSMRFDFLWNQPVTGVNDTVRIYITGYGYNP